MVAQMTMPLTVPTSPTSPPTCPPKPILPTTGLTTQSRASHPPLQPHPVIRFLHALGSFLLHYLTFGAPGPVAPLVVASVRRVRGLDFSPLKRESYFSTVLCCALPWFLWMAGWQRLRHRPACGGWAQANLYEPADLAQAPRSPTTLRGKSTVYLCELLHEELLLLLRLLRAAQRAYWREPTGDEWQDGQRAAMLVLVRIVQIGKRLRQHANRWYAEQCLRNELAWLWVDQFGADAEVPEEAEVWLSRLDIPPHYERQILKRLGAEAKWGYELPRPFRRLYARWQRGEVYPDVRAPQPRASA